MRIGDWSVPSPTSEKQSLGSVGKFVRVNMYAAAASTCVRYRILTCVASAGGSARAPHASAHSRKENQISGFARLVRAGEQQKGNKQAYTSDEE